MLSKRSLLRVAYKAFCVLTEPRFQTRFGPPVPPSTPENDSVSASCRYKVEADPDGAKDTCVLRFHGGPPYEDLAFKIVNRAWETSHKRGFRCRFERGIFQLYFNFQRYRYRR